LLSPELSNIEFGNIPEDKSISLGRRFIEDNLGVYGHFTEESDFFNDFRRVVVSFSRWSS
jgi:hypothetical protein